MKQILTLILLIAIALSAYIVFVGGDGLWKDTKTIRDRGSTSINTKLAPPP